jgi:hypothetical protein
VQPSSQDGPGGRDYFVYTLRPGQVFGDIVGISNLSDETLTFAVYPTDAYNTPDAGFALLREEERPVDVGTWVELGATQYTLDPGERVDIPFSLTVPADATPGDHAGAIVAQVVPEAGADQPDQGIGFDVRLRIGARIYVRVDGPLSPSLTIERFGVEYVTPLNPLGTNSVRVTYVVANTGNTRLQPTASLEIAGLFGLGSTQAPLREIPELLPGSSLEIAEIIRDVRPLGRLTATLRLQAPLDGVDVERSVSTWTIPWLLVVAWRCSRRTSSTATCRAAVEVDAIGRPPTRRCPYEPPFLGLVTGVALSAIAFAWSGSPCRRGRIHRMANTGPTIEVVQNIDADSRTFGVEGSGWRRTRSSSSSCAATTHVPERSTAFPGSPSSSVPTGTASSAGGSPPHLHPRRARAWCER